MRVVGLGQALVPVSALVGVEVAVKGRGDRCSSGLSGHGSLADGKSMVVAG